MSIDELARELRREARRARCRRLLLILTAILTGAFIGTVSTVAWVLHPPKPNPPLLLEEMAKPQTRACVTWRA
ncbi:MAG: hypothetical protein LLG20_18780 [Acidobacteriales bacterium]|nr:hypothetical protein [Terriglobales bacterium]